RALFFGDTYLTAICKAAARADRKADRENNDTNRRRTHDYPASIKAPRISIGWSTIHTPTANRQTIKTAHGASILNVWSIHCDCAFEIRKPAYSDRRRPKSRHTISSLGSQSATGRQHARAQDGWPSEFQPQSLAIL